MAGKVPLVIGKTWLRNTYIHGTCVPHVMQIITAIAKGEVQLSTYIKISCI